VEADIERQIDEMLKQQVAENLERHIPKKLQDELAERKRELEEVQRALHNSSVHFRFFNMT
jgi:hypothetical protein